MKDNTMKLTLNLAKAVREFSELSPKDGGDVDKAMQKLGLAMWEAARSVAREDARLKNNGGNNELEGSVENNRGAEQHESDA